MPSDRRQGSFFGPTDLVDLLRHRAEFQPDDRTYTFLVDGETEEVHLTNRELDRQARAIAAWLQSHGLAGQRALLLYPAGLDFIAAFFGCLYAGVVAVTAYPPRPNRSLERIQAIVDDAQARVALTISSVWDRIQPMLPETPHLEQLDWLSTDQTPPGSEDQWQPPAIDGDTLAFLQYTSGSTGTPKGVMLSHRNLLHNSALIGHAFEHTRSSSGVFWLPSYHDMGLVGGILQPLYIGRSNALMSPMSFLTKPVRWLRAITRYGASTSGGPNFAYDLCVDKIAPEDREGLDLSSWQVAFNGAEPIRAETLDRFVEAFGPYGFRREAFYPCYGLAEATLIVSGGHKHAAPVVRGYNARSLENDRALPATETGLGRRLLVGSGAELPDQQVVIVDPDTKRRCADGEIGEVWVQGPSIAQGYWQRPEESAETFGAMLDNGQGPFLRTGDLGFLDSGELFVTGRIKDLIILRGVNHYPQDIEATAERSHPALRRGACAAFTIDGEGGRPRLVVVQEIERRRHDEAPEAVRAIRHDVAREHELDVDTIVLVKLSTVPKTSSGKTQRRECRRQFLAGELAEVARWHRGDVSAIDPRPVRREAAAKRRAAVATMSAGHANGKHGNGAMATSNGNGRNGNGRNGNGHHGHAIGGNGHAKSIRPVVASASHRGNGSHAKAPAVVCRPAGGVAADEVLKVVRSLFPDRAAEVNLDVTLAELGLDSLQRIDLQVALEERFGGRFPEEVAVQLETLREIADAVAVHLGGAEPTGQPLPSLDDIPPEHYCFDKYPEYVALQQRREMLEGTGLANPFFCPHESVTADTAMIGGRELINFANYNYIGMSGDPVVMEAAQEAIRRYGTSVSASRLVSGEKVLHRELERALADFVGAEDAIVYVGGHATNETTIGHLFGRGDLILHDALAHNSIVQGAILSGAARRAFPHNDFAALDRMLTDLRPRYRRLLVAIEGVYSMDGDFPDLPQFIEVKKRHKAFLLVDEAHSAGVLGRHGRGIGEHFQVHPRDVDLWMGTLSKSFGSCGGYIAGSQAVVEYLKYTAPGFVFSCGISPPNAAAALASLRLLEEQPERVAVLHDRSRLFLELARTRGLNTGLSRGTPVIPVILGNSLDSLRLSQALFERGINVQPILYPAVEESAARLRFFITSKHSEEQIRDTVDATAEELARINPAYLQPARPRSARAHKLEAAQR